MYSGARFVLTEVHFTEQNCVKARRGASVVRRWRTGAVALPQLRRCSRTSRQAVHCNYVATHNVGGLSFTASYIILLAFDCTSSPVWKPGTYLRYFAETVHAFPF